MRDFSAAPFREEPTEPMASLVRSVRRIAQAIDVRSREVARLTGLTLPQLLVLQSIRDLGEVSTSAISRDVSMSPPTVVAVLDKLELARSTDEEKQSQLQRLADFHDLHAAESPAMLQRLQQAVIENQNVFEVLMNAVRVCSLGQITNALFEVGGQYRRNM
jgi:DNA-binding transcriptional ArsR family regulator